MDAAARVKAAIRRLSGHAGWYPSDAHVQQIIAAARPTADLGEDGELIAALWSYAHDLKVAVPLRQAMEDARDRLILYREALVKCRDKFEFYEQCHRLKCTAEGDEKADRNHELVEMIDALLSRNQGPQ